MASEIDTLLGAVRRRFDDLKGFYRDSLLLHLQSLARHYEESDVYDEQNLTFPVRVHVAFAICQCGIREFIIEGSTQECQNCGSLMFRTEVAEYELVQRVSPPRKMLSNPQNARRLEGTWYHPDTSAEYTIRVLRTKIAASGVDTDDGEKFIVSDVDWDGKVLKFTSLMPSTGWKTIHRLSPNRGSTLKHEFTCFETWKKRKA